MNEEWKSCVQGKPTNDGKYYVYISNLQIGDELRIMSYEKNHWNCLLEPDERIIAWKKIEEKKIEDKNAWLKDHVKDIQKIFGLKCMKKELEIVLPKSKKKDRLPYIILAIVTVQLI